jgi:hypothetical protein
MKNKKLIAWKKATNALAQEFCNKYFDKTKDWDWTAYDIGSVLNVGDYFFNLDRIVESLEINCSRELLIQFYDYEIGCYYNKKLPKYNFKTWVKYYAGFGYKNETN